MWLANVVTVIGAQLTVVAVPAQIYAITGSSGMVGLTGLFGLVPLIIFGLWGGALADSMDRRVLLEFTTTGMIVTSGLFWLQAFLGLNNVWILLGVFAIQQSFFAINQPTRTAILPKLVPSDQLPAANTLNMTVISAGAIAGPMVGGALIPVLGYAGLYLIDTFFLFATLYAVWRLAFLPVDKPMGTPGALRCRLGRCWAGSSAAGSREIRRIVVVAGGPRIADVLHGGAAEVVGPAWATGGGGLLVIVGIAIVAIVAPAFRRFRLSEVTAD